MATKKPFGIHITEITWGAVPHSFPEKRTMAKKNNKLMEYNKACAAAGLTYAQMQQKESTMMMGSIRAPRNYRKASEWKQLSGRKKRVCYVKDGDKECCKAEHLSNGYLKKKCLSCKWVV